jgi:hypothetical protein
VRILPRVQQAERGGRTVFRHRLVLCSALLLILIGCAQTQSMGRDVSRVGPYRDVSLIVSEIDEAPIVIHADRQLLTDAELSELERSSALEFANRIRNEMDSNQSSGKRQIPGQAQLALCRIHAGIGRSHTVYEAQCRARIQVDDVVLAESEGRAKRRVRNRGLTQSEADAIDGQGRHPLFDFSDTRSTLEEAIESAALALIDPRKAKRDSWYVEDSTRAQKRKTSVDGASIRRSALQVLERPSSNASEKAAAAIDLSKYGQAEDGASLALLFRDESPLVRRAALMALGELAPLGFIADVSQMLDDPDEMVRSEAALTLSRLCALANHAAAGTASSNSSGSGGGVAASNPADPSASIIWDHSESCSKR